MGKFRQGNTATSKLTPEQVLRIRELFNQGYSQRQLGEAFNMSTVQIGRITRGESWRQYTQPKDFESAGMHREGLQGGWQEPSESELAESAKRLAEALSQGETQVHKEELSEGVRKRLAAYGASVASDEPSGSGLARLASELETQSVNTDELLAQLEGKGDSND